MEQRMEIIEADLRRIDHQRDVVALTDAYASDPMGGGRPLAANERARRVYELAGFTQAEYGEAGKLLSYTKTL